MRTEKELKPELTKVREVVLLPLPTEEEQQPVDQLITQNKVRVHAVSKSESPFHRHGCSLDLQMDFEIEADCTVRQLKSRITSNRKFRETFMVLYET